MKVVCAWCEKFLGEKEPVMLNLVTHGMCQECRDRMKEELDFVKKGLVRAEPVNSYY